MSSLRRKFGQRLNVKQDRLPALPGLLGDGAGNVDAGGGRVYVRVAEMVNTAVNETTPAIYDLPVWVGYHPAQPTVLRVLSQRLIGTIGTAEEVHSGVAPHAASHEWMGPGVGGGTDVVKVHLQQFLPLRVMPYDGLTVMIYPGLVWTGAEYKLIADTNAYGQPIPKTIDFRSYIYQTPSDGKEFFHLITISSTGDLVVTSGSEVNVGTITLADIPAIPAGTLMALAAVRRYYGQFEYVENRVNSDIVDLRFPNAHTHAGGEIVLSDDLADILTPSGTALDLQTQAANLVLAGPESGAAAKPTFRALVGADIPADEISLESLGNVIGSGQEMGDILQHTDWMETPGGAEALFDSALLSIDGTGTNEAKAINKNMTDLWESEGGGPHWCIVTFPRKRFISKVVITAKTGTWMWANYPRAWTIYGSHSGSFSGEEATLGSGTASGPGVYTTILNTPRTAYRYYKIAFGTNPYNLNVNELEFYTVPDQAVWSNKTLAGAGIAAADHDHDADYAPISHTHTESDITDLDHDAAKIDGIAVDLTGIADGNALVYDSGTGEIVPGEGGGGGHEIQNNGTPMTQRAALNFIGFEVTDDAGNDATKVTLPDGAYAETIGDGTNSDFDVVHGLGTEDIIVQLWDLTGVDPVEATADASAITIVDANTVNVAFASPPATDAYRVVVLMSGGGGSGGAVDNSICNGRLTLESGVPVSTTDQTAKSTLYFTPYKGNRIALYDGSAWSILTFSELSLDISGYTANKNYDIWAYNNSGAVALESTAWTNDTTRATPLATQDGVYVKSGAATRRYLGTIRITGTAGQCEDSVTKRFVWNYRNRVKRPFIKVDPNSHVYSTNAWRYVRNDSANKIELVIGVAEDATALHLAAGVRTDGTGRWNWTTISYDTSTAEVLPVLLRVEHSVNTAYARIGTSYEHITDVGYHYYAMIQLASGLQSNWIETGINGYVMA